MRSANRQDIPFLALMDLEASRSPFAHSFWDELLAPTGTSSVQLLESMFRCGASLWGRIEDFLIIERDKQPVATCAVYRPSSTPVINGPFNLSKLPEIAEMLDWNTSTAKRFEQAYIKVWGNDNYFLKPQAELIVETVAVAPGHRGSGLGHSLMKAAFKRAREAGASSLGVMVIHGNDPAKALYEKYFEPFISFHSAFFDGTFPGLTKYRANLNH
ncbi:nourseothricin-resistance protein [Leptolyngbya sp. Heron Island J]|nr:nourseothricin-resistance protein [Leptolyngbya sp. Heron Island J]